MVYFKCLPRRTPLLSMHARACISAITPNTCSTAQLPPPPQPTPPSPRPSPPAPRPLSPPPPWVARRPIASFIRFFWGPSFVKKWNSRDFMKWNSRDSEYGILAEDESWIRLSRLFGHPGSSTARYLLHMASSTWCLGTKFSTRILNLLLSQLYTHTHKVLNF